MERTWSEWQFDLLNPMATEIFFLPWSDKHQWFNRRNCYLTISLFKSLSSSILAGIQQWTRKYLFLFIYFYLFIVHGWGLCTAPAKYINLHICFFFLFSQSLVKLKAMEYSLSGLPNLNPQPSMALLNTTFPKSGEK